MIKEGSGVNIVPAVIPSVNSNGKLLVGGKEIPNAQLSTFKTKVN